MEISKSASGQRLSPMALIDLFKADTPKIVRPKSISPPTTRVTNKGLNWHQVDVSPVVKSKNSNSLNVTPKSIKTTARKEKTGRNANVSESPTLNHLFSNHNAQHWQQQTSTKFTPPRQFGNGGLRRQQSASATLVGGNGRVYLQCHQKSGKENNNFNTFGRPATVFTSRPRGIDQSYVFAASKYCESPKSLPLPPNLWMDDTDDEEAEEVKKFTLTQNTSSPGRLMATTKKALKKVSEEKNNDVLSDDAGIVFDVYGEDDSSSSDSASIPSSEGIVGNLSSPVSDMEINFMDYGHSVSGMRIHPLQLIASVASA